MSPVESFEEWYVRVHPRLAVAIAAAFGSGDLAGEATDEAFLRAFERWQTVSAMGSPDGWVFRVGFNVAKRRLRRRAVERRLIGRDDPSAAIAGPAGEVWELVAQLPPRQRCAVVLRHVGQFTEREIATVMGIARGSVSSTLRDAYRSLQRDIEPVGPREQG